jgi:hypothetical protein
MNFTMKTITLTALLTGLFVLPFVLHRRGAHAIAAQSDEDIRYDVDDYIEN